MSGEIIDKELNVGVQLTVAAYDEGVEMVKEGSSVVYIGNLDVAKNLEWLKKNVEAIVNVSEDIENFYPRHFAYLRIPVNDSPNTKIIKFFDCANQFIREKVKNGGSVLVHCQKGDSRSVTIILCYLLKYHNISLKEAIDLLQTKGISHILNKGFVNQLSIFEKRVFGKNTYENVTGKRKISSLPVEQENPSAKKRKLNDLSPQLIEKRHLSTENIHQAPPLSPKKMPLSPLKTPKKSVLSNITNQRLPTPYINETCTLQPSEDFPHSPLIKRSKPLTPRPSSNPETQIQVEQLKKVRTNLTTLFDQM